LDVDIILQVFVIFVAAKAAAEVFVRLNLPAIAGELLVGVILGPHVTGIIELNQSTNTLSELGIVILLFAVGLQTPLSELLSVGRTALVTSVAGILAAGGTGVLILTAFGLPAREGLLAGIALAASSVGVAARVFQDFGLVQTRPARVVLGAAVVDDVVVLALFPLVSRLGGQGASVGSILTGLAGVVAFIVIISWAGSRLARRHGALLDRPRVRRSPFVLALALCLGLAALAERVGLAALVGAFLAGMVLAETGDRYELDRRMLPLVDFLVPFFFVLAAARMDPARLASGSLALTLVLVPVTLLAKAAGCAGGAMGLGTRDRMTVGAGMIPRNEVTLVVASAALTAGTVGQDVFSVLVAAVLVTTLVSVPLLRLALPGEAVRRIRADEGPPEAPGVPEPPEAPPQQEGGQAR
jgi:Kef-type K+ transport system membrane component KefB